MKSKYVPSIVQNTAQCYLCGRLTDLELHHCIPGRGNRKICTELGLTVWLCRRCHADLHDRGIGYKKVQEDAQKAFIKKSKKQGLTEDIARSIWYERFKKFYDE